MPDILIHMDMPQHCFNCSTKINPDERRCNVDGHVFEETLSKLTCRRDEDCPLHELPPHGDLIDRGALMEEHAKAESRKYGNLFIAGDNRFIHRFLDAPVIVPADKEDTPNG